MNSRTKKDLLVRQSCPMPPGIPTNSCRQQTSSPTCVPGCDTCTYLVMLACCLKSPAQLTHLGCLVLLLVLMRYCSPVMLLHQAKTTGIPACSCSVADTIQKQRTGVQACSGSVAESAKTHRRAAACCRCMSAPCCMATCLHAVPCPRICCCDIPRRAK